MDIFEKIKELSKKDRNEYLDGAIQSGKKVMGYFCSYVPEEIIAAAGFVPYRMRAVASGGTEKGDVYYASINCTFVRHCFNKVLSGHYDFLDGIVFMNGCDHTRRMYDNWRYAGKSPDFKYMFDVPHVIDETALGRMESEIEKLKTGIEEFFEVEITDEALSQYISLYNKKRELLQRIDDSRKSPVLSIKGSEFLALMLVITMVPVEDAVEILETVLASMEGREVSRNDDLRVVVSSGCMEEPEHIELIESQGGAVVGDTICLGSKHFHGMVDASLPPAGGLARRYLEHLSCPRMMNDFRRRLSYVDELGKARKAEAFIIEKLKFCDLWGGETFLYRQESKRKGFPLLTLERELYGGSEGQLKTRIQAFFEQVKNMRGAVSPVNSKTKKYEEVK